MYYIFFADADGKKMLKNLYVVVFLRFQMRNHSSHDHFFSQKVLKML